ncbi:MAG: amidohydrolase [Gemmatimonadales bacterium]
MHRFIPAAAYFGVLLLAACGPTGDGPDRILHNGRVWTGDSANPEVQALAITGDRIVAVGTDAEVRTLRGRNTLIEDLGGRRVVPGFHDAHMHFPARRTADLTDAAGPEEIVARLQAFAEDLPADAWLTGRGWTPVAFPEQRPHRRFLDAAFPDRPVLITDRDGHLALANTAALALAEVMSTTPDPAGGEIGRDADGAPTGLLKEGAAMRLVSRLIPPPGIDEVYAGFMAEMHRMAALGLTAVQVANAPSDALTQALNRAVEADSMLLRVRIAVPFSAAAHDSVITRYLYQHRAHQGPYLRYGVAKGMLDGTVDGGTAAMLAPFATGEGSGIPMWEQEELNRTVARYHSGGIQVQLHAIGDRAIRMALDAFEYAQRVSGPGERRHRVEHLEVPAPLDLPRFAALGVVASTQAIFVTPDATTLTNYAPKLGPERAARAMPFRSLDDAGAIQAFGSDYPVFPISPLLGIYTAVTRQLPDGIPPGGWYPDERISVEAALRHYTWGSAYAAVREHELGTLAPGKLADFVVLSTDIFSGPLSGLLDAEVLLTVMGGRETHRAPRWP